MMPRTTLPPTPSSSTDIHGKDGTKQMANLQLAFELPPPAMTSAAASRSRAPHAKTPKSPESHTSPKTPYPMQPSEVVKSRKRSAAAPAANSSAAKDSFALPPPPTRSRKIIQMKPRTQDVKKPTEPLVAGPGKGSTAASSRKSAAAAAAAVPVAATASNEASSSKKKQPSTTSVAGRKIARKTAHSLIERRRRSKMNEEFAVLKNMIPACTGEMHKLAILQASIEYVRYLQDCIDKLKAQREEDSSLATPTNLDDIANERSKDPYDSDGDYHQTTYTPEEQYSPDVEMTESDVAISPTFATYPSSSTRNASHISNKSPSLAAQDSTTSPVIHRHGSYSSASTAVDNHRHYSFGTTTTSPAFGPQQAPTGAGWYAHSTHSASGSTSTSPALGPLGDRDMDQEATAALLMLNSDRRGIISNLAGDSDRIGGTKATREKPRGMSVKDLLSA